MQRSYYNMSKTKEENKKSVMEMITVDEPQVTDVTNTLSIDALVPFANHPFKPYEDSRFDDMVRSIKELGVIVPVIVRPKEDGIYEILSGHNRVNAAKQAGLAEVPVIIKENLTEEEASLIVTETNLVQRSFADLSHSERA
ncbi:MAG: ParB N-terminal domain-containing protein, partial [Chitinispirillales bacterium]|nr:ParB N-terminal domain-containing protein [Chitinispirillales bacterium]